VLCRESQWDDIKGAALQVVSLLYFSEKGFLRFICVCLWSFWLVVAVEIHLHSWAQRSDALPFSYILKETCDRLSLKGAGMSHTGSRLCASVISKLADVCITSSPHLTHQHAGANPNICRRRRRREINVKTQNFVHFAHYFPPFPSAIRIYWISKWHSRLNVMCRGRSRPEKQNRTTTGQTLGQSR
jgi:hypothetical protein